MTTTDPWIHDLARVHPGDRIEVWDQYHRCHAGTVSHVAAHLGVFWIREASTERPELISAQDYPCAVPRTPVAPEADAAPPGYPAPPLRGGLRSGEAPNDL